MSEKGTADLIRELRALAELATAAWANGDTETLIELTKDIERLGPEAADALDKRLRLSPSVRAGTASGTTCSIL